MDETILTTILRDFKIIGYRLYYALIPCGSDKNLRNYDLWGPLLFGLLLSMTLSFGVWSTNNNAMITILKKQSIHYYSYVFSIVFTIVWLGAFFVTLNTKLLGGKITLLQSLSLLGYCVFPLNIASFITIFIEKYLTKEWYFKEIIIIISLLWSIKASTGFMTQMINNDNKKLLAVYPIALFYVILSWMIMLQ